MKSDQEEFHIARVVLFTPARFIGEYSSARFEIKHAWPQFRPGARGRDERAGTHALVTFRIPSYEKAPGVVVPDYDGFSQMLAGCVSALFGKRFDNLGVLQQYDEFRVLRREVHRWDGRSSFCDDEPRDTLPVPLAFDQFALIDDLITLDGEHAVRFFDASRWYARALQMAQEDPGRAFLDLITAGEILSEELDRKDPRFLDDQMKKLLAEIERDLPNGKKKARQIRSRMYQAKRRFVEALVSPLNDHFFSPPSRGTLPPPVLTLTQESIRERLKAAYDLRSKHVHAGAKLNPWISGTSHLKAEIVHGKPVIGDEKLSKTWAKSSTFIGLERVIRFALLSYVHRKIRPMPLPAFEPSDDDK